MRNIETLKMEMGDRKVIYGVRDNAIVFVYDCYGGEFSSYLVEEYAMQDVKAIICNEQCVCPFCGDDLVLGDDEYYCECCDTNYIYNYVVNVFEYACDYGMSAVEKFIGMQLAK